MNENDTARCASHRRETVQARQNGIREEETDVCFVSVLALNPWAAPFLRPHGTRAVDTPSCKAMGCTMQAPPAISPVANAHGEVPTSLTVWSQALVSTLARGQGRLQCGTVRGGGLGLTDVPECIFPGSPPCICCSVQ